jgi:hypothetical protein
MGMMCTLTNKVTSANIQKPFHLKLSSTIVQIFIDKNELPATVKFGCFSKWRMGNDFDQSVL